MTRNTAVEYLGWIGTHTALCRAEVARYAHTHWYDQGTGVVGLSDLVRRDYRGLPKDPDRLWLDQMGGVMKLARVVKVVSEPPAVLEVLWRMIEPNLRAPHRYKLVLSGLGVPREFLKELHGALQEKSGLIRAENAHGQPMNTGRLFRENILRRGGEYTICLRAGEIIVAETVAVQNLRNYRLRDHQKPWRDSYMGMLPPKLAQIILNIADPRPGETVFDPFCGSGTICGEAGIVGVPTVGEDLAPGHIAGAQENWRYLTEKFRLEGGLAQWAVADATKTHWRDRQGVLCTEGWLGQNFREVPTQDAIGRSRQQVGRVWRQLLGQMRGSGIRTVVACIPRWAHDKSRAPLSAEVRRWARENGYEPVRGLGGEETYVYSRPEAHTAREIIWLAKKI